MVNEYMICLYFLNDNGNQQSYSKEHTHYYGENNMTIGISKDSRRMNMKHNKWKANSIRKFIQTLKASRNLLLIRLYSSGLMHVDR